MLNNNAIRRSLLGIPGNELQIINEAIESDTDEIFIDLEDSLAPGEKNAARLELIDTVKEHNWKGKTLSYRINGVNTQWWHKDIIDVIESVGKKIDTLIVPKVQNPSDIKTVESLVKTIENVNDLKSAPIGISAQIETATGMNAIAEIANASDRLNSLIFGPADYATSIGASHGFENYPDHYWHYPLSRISQVAASAGLLAIGGVHTDPNNTREFEEACMAEAALGYDGKIVVIPEQIETANRLFSPSEKEAIRAQEIVERYDSTSSGDVTVFEGRIIDQEMYEMAKKILFKARESDLL